MTTNANTIVRCAAALTWTLSAIPALADVCEDFRADVGKMSDAINQEQTEMARVSSNKPLPRTDAALCDALWKVHDQAETFIYYVDEECFDDKEKLSSFNDDVKTVYHEASTELGIFHCSR